MTQAYRIPAFLRVANTIMAALLRRGVRVGNNALLTVPGRKSGQPRTTPVTLLEWQGQRYLQSPFGEVNWVRNLRAAGRATLTRGRQREAIAVIEVSHAEAAQVYQATMATYPAYVKGHFDVSPDSSLEAFAREASRHPMFRVMG